MLSRANSSCSIRRLCTFGYPPSRVLSQCYTRVYYDIKRRRSRAPPSVCKCVCQAVFRSQTDNAQRRRSVKCITLGLNFINSLHADHHPKLRRRCFLRYIIKSVFANIGYCSSKTIHRQHSRYLPRGHVLRSRPLVGLEWQWQMQQD